MTVNQLDVLAGVILYPLWEKEGLSYEEAIVRYERIREVLSKLNEEKNESNSSN